MNFILIKISNAGNAVNAPIGINLSDPLALFFHQRQRSMIHHFYFSKGEKQRFAAQKLECGKGFPEQTYLNLLRNFRSMGRILV
jgi:hypothetical protein